MLARLSFIQSRCGDTATVPGGTGELGGMVDPMMAEPSTSAQSSVPSTSSQLSGTLLHTPRLGIAWPWGMGSPSGVQGLQVPQVAPPRFQVPPPALPGAQGYPVLGQAAGGSYLQHIAGQAMLPG